MIIGISAVASRCNFLSTTSSTWHIPYFKIQPHSMSSDSGTSGASILDEALACIGERIASILVQVADKDKNYIASLRNEVVGISYG